MKGEVKKNLLLVAGIASLILGLVSSIPGFLQEKYGLAIGGGGLIVLGLILLAFAFGD